jgi:hypothetical protein
MCCLFRFAPLVLNIRAKCSHLPLDIGVRKHRVRKHRASPTTMSVNAPNSIESESVRAKTFENNGGPLYSTEQTEKSSTQHSGRRYRERADVESRKYQLAQFLWERSVVESEERRSIQQCSTAQKLHSRFAITPKAHMSIRHSPWTRHVRCGSTSNGSRQFRERP